jgi:hypothetical protein
MNFYLTQFKCIFKFCSLAAQNSYALIVSSNNQNYFFLASSGSDFAFIVWQLQQLALSPLDEHIKMPSAQLASSLCANNVCSPAAEVGSGSCINKKLSTLLSSQYLIPTGSRAKSDFGRIRTQANGARSFLTMCLFFCFYGSSECVGLVRERDNYTRAHSAPSGINIFGLRHACRPHV